MFEILLSVFKKIKKKVDPLKEIIVERYKKWDIEQGRL